jgi:hypothetical protein
MVQNKLNSVSIYEKVSKKKKLHISSLKANMNLRFHLLNLFFISISFTTVAQTEIHRDSATVPGIDTAQNKIFEKVDIQATFPGGEVAWKKFLERHLWAEVAVQNRAPVGIYYSVGTIYS